MERLIKAEGSNEKDVQRRIGRILEAFGIMARVWKRKELTKKANINIIQDDDRPTTNFPHHQNVARCENKMRKAVILLQKWLRRIAGVTRLHKIHVRNDAIRQAYQGQTTIANVVQRRLHWFEHAEK